MRPVLENGKLDAVLSTVLANVRVMPSEMMPLKWCEWRFLGADLVSGENIPPFAMAAITGYAVCSPDIAAASADAPVILELVERVAAGQHHQKKLESGQTAFVEAGAQIPKGADAVIPERLVSEIEGKVGFSVTAPSGTGIEDEGSVAKIKSRVMTRGDFVTPARAGLLAALGKNEAAIVRAPTVGVIIAGRELAPYDSAKLRPAQARDAYSRLIAARLSEHHLPSLIPGEVLNAPEQLAAAVARTINQVDIVLVCGNLAADRTLFEFEAIKNRIEPIAIGLNVCPAVGFTFALLDGKPMFGLSGPPERVLLGIDCLVFPAILKAMGARRFYERDRTGKLDRELSVSADAEILIRATMDFSDAGCATLRPAQGGENANLSQITRANSIIRLAPGTHLLDAGAEVRFFLTSSRLISD